MLVRPGIQLGQDDAGNSQSPRTLDKAMSDAGVSPQWWTSPIDLGASRVSDVPSASSVRSLDMARSHREILDDILALFRRKTMNSEQQLVDSLTDRQAVADQEHTWHVQAALDSVEGESGNRPAVMRQQHQSMRRGPLEYLGIGCCRQAHVSNMGKLQRRIAAG